jgi:hypothetical protein
MTTVHDERLLLQEVRRIYLATSTQPGAAEEYLRAISGDVDDLLAYLQKSPIAFETADSDPSYDTEGVLEVLEALRREGEEFSRNQKEEKSQ